MSAGTEVSSAEAVDLGRVYDEIDAFEDGLASETAKVHLQRLARAEAHRREAAAAIHLPPAQPSYSLGADLAQSRPVDEFAVEGLLKRGHNATLVATYKTGKTSLACDLARCLADSEPFLGGFATTLQGNVGFLNAEMDRYDWRDYMAQLAVRDVDRVRSWHLRGYHLPLLTDAGADGAIDWLKDNDVRFWIVDSWARLCAWSGVNENHNDEVARLTARLDEIKTQAGVGELLLVAHTGRAEHEAGAERARGATVLDDWVDGRWVMTRDRDSHARFLAVEGRGVELRESELERDLAGRFKLLGGTRAESKVSRVVDELVAIVQGTPGLKTGEATDRLTSTANAPERSKAVRVAKNQGRIHAREEGTAKLLHPGAG